MARPERKNVDYFPHYMNHGAKMKYLEKKYGNDGYAVWYKIIERLGKSENHFVDLNDEIQITFLSDFCNVTEDVLLEIISFLVKAKWLNKKLWEKKVLFSAEFLESISDAYERRKNDCINEQAIELIYHINPLVPDVSDDIKPQSIVEYTKPDNTKPDNTKEEPNAPLLYFQNKELNDCFTLWLKVCEEKGKPHGQSSTEALQMKLNRMSVEKAIATVEQSASENWITLQPLKNPIEKEQSPEDAKAGELMRAIKKESINAILFPKKPNEQNQIT